MSINSVQAAIAYRSAAKALKISGSGGGITLVGTGQEDDWTTDWVQPQLPSYAIGDFFICVLESKDNVASNITSPSGWNKLYSSSNGANSQASLFYKFATSSSEANPFFTHTLGGSIIANCSAFRGVDTTNPFDTPYAAAASVADNTVETGTLTTVTPNSMLLFAGHMADDHSSLSVTSAGGLTWSKSFFNIHTNYNGDGPAISLHYALKPTAGSIGPIVGTVVYSGSSTAAVSNGVLLALRPLASVSNILTINNPTGTTSGDVMIASLAVTPGTVTIAAPTGWTLVRTIQNTSSTTSRLAVFQRVATASEPASYTWTFGASHTGAVGGIMSFSGVDNSSPIATENGSTTASSTTHAAPSISPTTTNVMLVGTFSYASSGTWTPPTGMTEAVDVASRTTNSGSGESMEMTYQLQATATATGIKSAKATATSDRGATHLLALKPSGGSGFGAVDHIQIEQDGSGVTCVPETIVIKACANSACSILYAGSTTVTLLPSATGNISWGTNPITFTGSTSVSLSVTSAQTVSLGTSAVVPATVYSTSCYVNAAQNCSLPFASSGFAFSSISTQTAGTTSSAINLQAITGGSGGTCSGLSSGSKNIEMAFQCIDPGTCAGMQVSVNATPIAINPATGVSVYTSVSLSFDTASKTSFTLNYPDVGKITLAARYALGGGSYMQGNSNLFIVKPWGFAFSNIKRTVDNFANPAASTASGTVFIKAGNPFSSTVTSITSSNTATPNFGKESSPEGIVLSHNLVAPNTASGGTIGILGGSLLASGSQFTNGATQITDLSWDDVGIISLTANIDDGDYMGVGDVSSTSANVGRFTPDHFSTAVTPACSSATPFTYSGQHADVTISALDASEDITANYDYSLGFSKTVTLSDAGNVTGFTLNTLGVDLSGGIGTDADVIYTFSSKLTAPKTLNIRATDTDGVSSQGFSEDTDLIYSGRLDLQNAYGSELMDLPVSLSAQYWNGSSFVLNSNDSCTAVSAPASGAGLTFYSEVANNVSGNHLSAAETTATVSATGALVAGDAQLIFSAPGALNDGYVDISIPAPSWLKFDWNSTAAGDENPSGRATFGIYKGNSKLIYIREVY
jgi:MSHA biogenesis protein MshQ